MEHITSENILLIGSVLLIAGVLIGKSSYRIGLPLLFIFLIVGMLFGTDGLGIQFSDMHTSRSTLSSAPGWGRSFRPYGL